jgi:tetratricopeptide (TPR) repeat protein
MESRLLIFVILFAILVVFIGIRVFVSAGNEKKRLVRAGELRRKEFAPARVREQLVAEGAAPEEADVTVNNALASEVPKRADANVATRSGERDPVPPHDRASTADRTATAPSPLPATPHERGIALYKRSEHASAIEALTQAIELDPLFPNSYLLRAVCYRRLDNFPAAIADEQKAEALGGAEKTAWDRLVNRSRHRWNWDFDNPDWRRTDPLSRKAVLFRSFMSQIFNGGLRQWVANGYGRWICDLVEAAREVDTPATRDVAALLEELSGDLAELPLDGGWQEDDELEEQEDRLEEPNASLDKIFEYESRYTRLESRFGQDVANWLEHKAAIQE